MTELSLQGLKVTLGQPTVVSEAVGHLHFPSIAQFPSGELLISASIVPDRAGRLINAQRIFISGDQGESWQFRYTVSEAHANAKFPRPNGDLLMKPSRFRPDPPGQWQSFVGPYVRYENGGDRIVIEGGGSRVEGLPRNVEPPQPGSVLPGLESHGALYFGSRIIEVGGRLLTSPYLTFEGDDQYSTAIFASDDEGRTWRYLSTAAGPEAEHGLGHGPAEASMVELETGEIMIVMREGWTGTGWPLVRSYSDDGGESWSEVDHVPAFSVEPALRRLSNGALVITAGRPGIYMWLSTDPRGRSWQQVDILGHHNEWAPGREYVINSQRWLDRDTLHNHEQTTAYTDLVEIEPNRLLMVYDRIPFGWSEVPSDSDKRSRIFVLPISVERT